MTETPLFKSRGRDTTRTEAFVDAAFAFATTRLVISFNDIPASYAELINALKGVPAFLASFAIVAMFWVGHRNWSDRYGLNDGFSTFIGLILVCVILVYVYPLRTMMAAAFELMSNGWIPRRFQMSTLNQARGLFTIYGLGFQLASLCVLALYVYAWRRRRHLQLTAAECHATISEIFGWRVMIGVALVSVVLAWILPENQLSISGWIYALLGILMPGLAVIRNRSLPVH